MIAEQTSKGKSMQRTLPLPATELAIPVAKRPTAAPRELWRWAQGKSQSGLVRGVAWSVIGSGFSQGGSFLSSIVLARVLGKESFGQFALIQSTVTAVTSLAGLGLGLTATKYISECRAKEPERIGKLLGFSTLLILITSLCFSIALGLLAPKLAVQPHRDAIISGIRLSTPYVFFSTVAAYQLGILAGFEAFRIISQIGMACGLAVPLLSWFGAVGFGMAGAVVAQGIAAILLWSLYEIAVRRECRSAGVTLQFRNTWDQRSILTQVSIPATASGAICSLGIWAGNAILVKACGYSELAVFSAAYNLRSIVLFLPALIFRVASPRLNFLFAAGDLLRYSRAFWGIVRMSGLLAVLSACLAFRGAQPFLHLFGKEFTGSNWLLGLILGAAVVEVTSNHLYITIVASGRFWRNLAVMILWTAALCGMSTVAAPHYRAAGLAAAYLGAWSIVAALFLTDSLKLNRNRSTV